MSESTAEVFQHLLMFRAGQLWFAVSVSLVVELLPRESLLQIPCLPPHVPGLMKYRERALPLLDLERFLNLKTTTESSETLLDLERVIVVNAAQMQVGICCQRASRIIEIPQRLLQPVETIQEETLRRFSHAEFTTDEGFALWLDFEKLLHEARVR